MTRKTIWIFGGYAGHLQGVHLERRNGLLKIAFLLGTFSFLFLMGISGAVFGQSPPPDPPISPPSLTQEVPAETDQAEKLVLDRNYWQGYITDTKKILASPLQWDQSDWVTAALVAGTTIGLYVLDPDIQNWAQSNRSQATDETGRIARAFGSGYFIFPTLGAFYLYGHFFEDPVARRATLLGVESAVLSGLFAATLKFAGHRHRPSSGDPHDTWDGPSFSTHHLSFPSESSALAFAVATTLASEYRDRPLIPPLAYTIATLVALSRVNSDSHWASDVFFGSSIGFLTAKAISRYHASQGDQKRDLTIFPLQDDRYTGLILSLKF